MELKSKIKIFNFTKQIVFPMRKKYFPISSVLLLYFVTMNTGCRFQGTKDELAIEADTTQIHSTTKEQLSAQNVFNAMPGKQQITELINTHQIEYNVDYVNDPTRVNNYNLENKRAVNLGIYGTDLIIASTFDQTQETMSFLKAVNGLAANLGVSAAFNQKMMDRLEASKENRDSTLEIVAGAFKKADTWLKENNRPATSALIVCGTWLEALYVAARYTEPHNDKKLAAAVLAQQESLKNLIELLNTSEQTTDIKEIKIAFENLKKEFDKAASTEDIDKSLVMKTISAQINELRSKWVK
jgi:hypothetical protein